MRLARILHVDDSEEDRDLLGLWIKRGGLINTIQSSPSLEEARLDPCPDVLILDLVLPGGGAKVLETLLEKCPHTRIVVCSGFREGELPEGALEWMGAYAIAADSGNPIAWCDKSKVKEDLIRTLSGLPGLVLQGGGLYVTH